MLILISQSALDHVHLQNSAVFPTRCMVTVDGFNAGQVESSPPGADPYEWRLASKEANGLLRLHALDIYFWSLDDANQFMDLVVTILRPEQIGLVRPVPTESDQVLDPIVQQLETVAITDPGYQNGQTLDSKPEPASNLIQNPPNLADTVSFPPPPPGGPPISSQSTPTTTGTPSEEHKESANVAPLPYNPAAPVAPELIKHREKTPPPPDAETGTGLAAAVAADYGVPYTQPQSLGEGHAPTSSQTSVYSPATMPTSFAPSPASVDLTHSRSVSSSTSTGPPRTAYSSGSSVVTSPGAYSLATAGTPMLSSQMAFAPPLQDPNVHLHGQQQYAYVSQAPEPRLLRQQTAPPLDGYSSSSYQQHLVHHHNPSGSGNEYDIHSQVYRPTEVEAQSHYQKYAEKAIKNPGQRARKLEESAARVENSVNKFLKRLERRIA